MEVKLYVGNLSFNTTAEKLKEVFSEAGTVSDVQLIKDRDSGTSRGFAFVTMASQADANKAISTLNGRTVDDRQIKVNVAKEREERPRYGDPRGGGGGRRRY